jgi:hypothetical protein
MVSEAAQAFIDRCYKDGVAMAIHPIFDSIYEIDGKMHKFTKEVLEEIKRSNKVKVLYEGSKSANLMGFRQ